MRWAGFIGVALLLCTGCATRARPAVQGDAQLAQERRSVPRPDPLASPQARADKEVKRLTALRDALQTELRSAEDQLLIVVIKSADYDEQAGRKLDELQQRRLLISVALRDIELQRRQRAEDVINGLAEELPPTEEEGELAQELEQDEEGKLKASGIEALLARAKAQLARARLSRDRGMGLRWQSGQDGLVYGMGMVTPSAAPARGSEGERKFAGKKEMASKDWAPADQDKDADRRSGETTIALGEGWAANDDSPNQQSPPPGGGAVQAAAVVTGGAAPDLSAALRPLLPRMQKCIPKPKLSQGLAFTIRARLGTDGTVRGARLSSGHGLSPAAAACVVDVMRQMRLPKGGSGRIVSVPLRLSAR